jgi:hypothetical protein
MKLKKNKLIMKKLLFAHDSTLGGVSFISNYTKIDTILIEEITGVRKDMDEMIFNKHYFNSNKKKSLEILSNTEHIIIFGTRSLIDILNVYPNFLKIRKITLIISDSDFILQNNFFNNFLLKNKKILIHIMPDKIPFINKKLEYKPYFQPILLPNIKIVKNKELTICHSPGHKLNNNTKGSDYILKNIKNYNLNIITDKSWHDTLVEKSKSHIFIDQIFYKGMVSSHHKTNSLFKLGFKGGLGKSGLEAMLLECLTITSKQKIVTEPFFENPPILNCDETNLKKTIDYYINNQEKLNYLSIKQKEWAKKHLDMEYVLNNILN